MTILVINRNLRAIALGQYLIKMRKHVKLNLVAGCPTPVVSPLLLSGLLLPAAAAEAVVVAAVRQGYLAGYVWALLAAAGRPPGGRTNSSDAAVDAQLLWRPAIPERRQYNKH